MAPARNDFNKLLKEIDRVAASTLYHGPIFTAGKIVNELQQAGPSWTGKFSNSWQITTPSSKVFKCQSPEGEGNPTKINLPSVTGREVLKSAFLKDSVVFHIENISPVKLQAMDLKRDKFIRPTPKPETSLGLSKWKTGRGGRANPTLRGSIHTGKGSNASRTAKLHWFKHYIRGGSMDRTIKIEMDKFTGYHIMRNR